MPKLILFTFLLVTILAVSVVHADTFVVARGDPISYYGFDAPSPNVTEPFQLWIFGTVDGLYGVPSVTNLDQYSVAMPAGQVEALGNGMYTIYAQFPGPNHQFDISYDNGTLKTIYKAIQDTDMSGSLAPDIKRQFDAYLNTPPVDDIIINRTLSIEDPMIRVKNMYTTESGDLHMDLITNLKAGDKITSMIDEDQYNTPAYRSVMSSSATVVGDSNRSFSLDFTSKASEQLPSGMHFITIRFLESGSTVIPVERYSRYVPPTPTPVIQYYYDFSGNLIGYDINTTRPATAPTIVISPTVTPINWYQTVLNAKRVSANNRTVDQRGTVYVGEKNLDIYGTLGWMSNYNGNYGFTVQYCEWGDTSNTTADVIQINNPYHFDVDPDIFRNKLGAWCQHQSDFIEEHPPVAFIVLPSSAIYNMTTGEMDNGLIDVTNGTPVKGKNPATVTNKTNTTPTEDVLNVVITPTDIPTPPPTPEPIPTTDAIVLPLPAWLAVAALAIGVVLFRR